ncbi:MAG: YggT family protein [Clostridia bacterium]|jgi:amino acid transporter|nr:YggT family protein [Clostridia bacterium]
MDRTLEGNDLAKRIVYYVLGILEVLLLFRFLFKLLGANPGSVFVNFVYALSNVFLAPFYGIFRSSFTQGLETRAVFEPATLIAMAVYALIAYGIARFLELQKTKKIQ